MDLQNYHDWIFERQRLLERISFASRKSGLVSKLVQRTNLKNNSYKFFSYLDATVEDVIYEDQEVEKDIRTEEFIFKFDKEGHIVLK